MRVLVVNVCVVYDLESYFTFLNCELHAEIFAEILAIPRKLQFAVAQASLIFSKRALDVGSC